MAQRIASAALPAAAAAPAAADELEILHPERVIALGGAPVTVREYGNLEWLRLLPAAEPLVAAIAAALRAEQPPDYEAALRVLADHATALLPLVLQAADMECATFDALDGEEVELLYMTWWGVNGRFFVRRALNRVGVELARAAAEAGASPSAGARSTPPSSPTATAPGTLAATPRGS